MVKRTVLLTGFFRVFLLYDVAEAFDLEKLRRLVGPRGVPAQRPFPRRTPEYVRFEQVPIVERAEPAGAVVPFADHSGERGYYGDRAE